MFGVRTKSALLVDFDNVIGMTGGEIATRIPNWLAWLEDGGFDARRRKRTFAVKRVYWNPLNERYRAAFETAGFEAFACRAIAKEKKSSADIVMTLDAVDIASDVRGLKEVILMTSDTDFVPVVNRLQVRNLNVAAMGNDENSTAAIYREYADDLILRSAFRAAFDYQRPKARFFKSGAPAPAPTPAPRAPKPPPERSVASAIDLAADRVVDAAKGALGAQLSRQSVVRALHGVPGFSTTGASAWLSQGSYKRLLLAIAKKRRDALRLYAYRNGGVCVAYLSNDEA
ncbi:MAG: NYN domain-containing protein [Proteobacteria bacterium]|nr:NYN domain-containing protein [Pseudomonadota bacterium]